MQDKYAGQSGSFIYDPVRDERVPVEQWQAEQAVTAQGQASGAETGVASIAAPETEPDLESE